MIVPDTHAVLVVCIHNARRSRIVAGSLRALSSGADEGRRWRPGPPLLALQAEEYSPGTAGVALLSRASIRLNVIAWGTGNSPSGDAGRGVRGCCYSQQTQPSAQPAAQQLPSQQSFIFAFFPTRFCG